MTKTPEEKEKVNDWLYHPNGKDFLIEGSSTKIKSLLNTMSDQLVYHLTCYYPIKGSDLCFIQTKNRVRLDLKSFNMYSYPPMELFSNEIVDRLKSDGQLIEEEGTLETRLSFYPNWDTLECMSKTELSKFTTYLPKVVEYFWDKARDTDSAIGSDEESIASNIQSYSLKK